MSGAEVCRDRLSEGCTCMLAPVCCLVLVACSLLFACFLLLAVEGGVLQIAVSCPEEVGKEGERVCDAL